MPWMVFSLAVETSEAEATFLSVLIIYRCQANLPKTGLKEGTVILFADARADGAQPGGSPLGSPVGQRSSSGWAGVISQALRGLMPGWGQDSGASSGPPLTLLAAPPHSVHLSLLVASGELDFCMGLKGPKRNLQKMCDPFHSGF